MKPPKLFLAIPSLLLLAAGPVPAEIVERVVAKVNGQIVTLSEFEARQLAAVQAAGVGSDRVERFLRENNARILQEAIDDLLLVERAGEIGLRLRPDYVREVIEGIKKENNIETDAALQEQLGREAMSLDDLKRNIERSILKRQVLSRELEPKLAVSEAEVRADYEAHRAEYGRPGAVRLQEILVPSEVGDAEALARDIVARARAGEDFAALAKAYSSSATRDSGGDLGTLVRGEMSPEIEEAVSSLPPEAIAEPLRAAAGFRILRVVEKTEASVTPFEEVKAEIRRRLVQERTALEYGRYLEGLRKQAVVDVRVREVPLQVNLPTSSGPFLEPPAPAAPPGVRAPRPGAIPEAAEVVTSPQAGPERVVPPRLPGEEAREKKDEEAPPTPAPTPPPR